MSAASNIISLDPEFVFRFRLQSLLRFENTPYTNLDHEEAGLARMSIENECEENLFIYADWLEERSQDLAAYAQRLAARGFRWHSITSSMAGIVHLGKCFGIVGVHKKGFRCWRNTSESNQEYLGVLPGFEAAVLGIYSGLSEWIGLSGTTE